MFNWRFAFVLFRVLRVVFSLALSPSPLTLSSYSLILYVFGKQIADYYCVHLHKLGLMVRDPSLNGTNQED